MKKTYALNIEGKQPSRLLDAYKHDIRKYLKRERAKALPAGVDYLDFDCKLGANAEDAVVVHLSALIPAIDSMVASGVVQFHVEILAKFGYRKVLTS